MIEAMDTRSQGVALGAALILALASVAGRAHAEAAGPDGDPVRGGRLFLQCRACHTVGRSDPSGVGPNLWGVVGAKAGSKPGYHYSAALAGSGIVWTPAKLDQWLTQPTALVPGTNMAFQGVASPASRRDIIAYLATLGPEGAASTPATKP